MKTTISILAVVMLVLLGAGVALAQQQHPAPAAQPPAGAPPPGGMPGMHGDMGNMMDMCSMMMGRGMMGRGMMGGGMMGPGMMGSHGMMGGMGGMEMMMMHADPKTRAQMLELRGDIMKAVGEVLLKHAKTLESSAATK